MTETILREYAQLTVQIGANVQKGQLVLIYAGTDNAFFARLVAEEAYLAGAKNVMMMWDDEVITKLHYQYQTLETLETVPNYIKDQHDYFIENDACMIRIAGDTPGFMADADPEKMQKSAIAKNKALDKWRNYTMENRGQWTIVGIPTIGWAKKVFPDLDDETAMKKLWDAVLHSVRVTGDGQAKEKWLAHNKRLAHNSQLLNDFDFDSLHFTNSLGTDLVIGLVENHVWAGGGEETAGGVAFNPNMPTEENFTMPSKYHVDGKVVATMPLNYQGKLIENFSLTFKEGKVIDFDAETNKDFLEKLLDTDEGSRYIGEVALISYDSPIQQGGVLFLNTLYDENASCHLALGRAYPMNLKGGVDMELEELMKHGYNYSLIHADFMFGSRDMSIIGTKKDGTKVAVFENGNFAI